MAASIVRRLAFGTGLLLAVSVLGFCLLRLMPGDFAEVLLMAQMDGEIPSAEALRTFEIQNNFDEPLPLQYLRWLGGVLTGDLGTSLITGDPVGREIMLRLGNSLLLAGAALVLSLLIAIPIGFMSARYRGGIFDRLSAVVAVLGMSIPNFWYALLLALVFSLMLGWLPSSGYGSWQHAVLPTIVIGTSVCGVSARYIRSLLIDEIGRPYMRTAAMKGLRPISALVRHAGPNALPAILTLAGLQFARIFDGVIIVETLFGWPGIGRLLVESLLNRDFPLIQACFLVIAAAYVLTNLLVDLAISAVDPRVGEVV
ncbi:ABC transporter permease [Amorphus orientalis]|uniref:Peptide/nickel transport system permease protein n=1 Tax=Amorphus orientalis TaxID=649198 RepID=A0AAE3VLW9_9HYPH|nr:ABC transporter permease [Amorphus orientalis]MDQ0314091.1 peptide/nickel transport system permease protein [Amorphus orientalis]